MRFTNWRSLDRVRAADTLSATYVEAIRLTRGLPEPAQRTGVRPTMRRADELTASEREQFVALARVFGAIDDGVVISFDELFTERLAEVDRTGSFADDFEAATIEWWDVVDDEEHVAFELFFFGPGYGKLVEVGTTRFIGYVNQYDCWPEVEPNPYPDLWKALDKAQQAAKKLYPDSELAEMCVPQS